MPEKIALSADQFAGPGSLAWHEGGDSQEGMIERSTSCVGFRKEWILTGMREQKT
jgi:hypothetical protein